MQEGNSSRGAIVEILVTPSSKKESVEYDGNTLKIRVKEPADKGKANKAVIRLVSKKLGGCELVSGFTSKRKVFLIKNQNTETLRQLLESMKKQK